MKERAIETRIRRAAMLIAAGLVIQASTLLRVHPLSFVIFLGLACPLILAGSLLYLISLVSSERVSDVQEIGLSESASGPKARGAQVGRSPTSGS